jgi:hypothetical protein
LTYSNTFSNSDWGNGGYGNIANVVSNDIISPDGLMNGSKITFSAGSTQSRLIQQVSVVNGGIYEASVYVKYGNKTNISLYCDAAIIGLNAAFNFTTKTLTAYGVTNPIVTELSDGWFRLQFTYTAPSSTSQIGFISNIGEDGFVYSYGTQCEQGSYATSYIPTTSASVTRNADYLTRSGFGNTSTSGTLFFDFYATKILSPNGQYILNLFQGSVVDPSYPVYPSPNGLSIIANGGTIDIRNNAFTQQVQTFTPTAGQRVKIAIRYNGTNVSSAINGTLSSVFTDTAVGVKNALRINNGENGTQAFNAVAFFPSYLTDTQLAQLTTI